MFRFFLLASTTAVLFAACGSDEVSNSTTATSVARGEAIAQRAGCASCHGGSFQGGVGPGWVGVAGSKVELTDGSVAIADEGYLFESIRDPSAKVVAGYGMQMPRNSLSDDEIREVVAYIVSLSEGT
jgi:mono/diheme cytochrome c family protein